MKTNRSKVLITLLSVAAIGLSSAALQAGGDQQQLRHASSWGQHLEGIELSPALRDMVNQFRAKRMELMAEYREIHLQFREDMAPLIAELKALTEGTDDYADKLAEIQALREAHRAEFGTEFREARIEMRQMKRRLREQIREERTPPEEG